VNKTVIIMPVALCYLHQKSLGLYTAIFMWFVSQANSLSLRNGKRFKSYRQCGFLLRMWCNAGLCWQLISVIVKQNVRFNVVEMQLSWKSIVLCSVLEGKSSCGNHGGIAGRRHDVSMLLDVQTIHIPGRAYWPSPKSGTRFICVITFVNVHRF